MDDKEKYSPKERSIHLMCQLQLSRDITLISIPRYGENPKKIQLKSGTNLSLIDDCQMFCATEEGCGNGPLVRIDETKVNGAEINTEHLIGRSVVIPTRFLSLHPNVL